MKKTKGIIRKDAPDLLEPFLDEATGQLAKQLFHSALPELAKDLPIIKYFKTGVDLYGSYKLLALRKKMETFLRSMLDGNFDLQAYNLLEQDEKETMIDILVTELDSQTNKLQSEALGLLFIAYVQKNIDRLTFLGIAHELKNTNPLLFYFNADGIKFVDIEGLGIVATGAVHYMPISFSTTSSGTMMIAKAGGPVLTNLGTAFYENVYKPMSERYTM